MSTRIDGLDSGLLAYLLGVDETRLELDGTVTGMPFETFVVMELLRQSEWQCEPVSLYHYRDKDGREIDAVLERRDGTVVGIEVKAAASVSTADFRGLRRVRDALGERFKAGAVIYTGANTLPFGECLAAVPLSGLCPLDSESRRDVGTARRDLGAGYRCAAAQRSVRTGS